MTDTSVPSFPTLGDALQATTAQDVPLPDSVMNQPQVGFGPRPVEILSGIEISNKVTVGIYGAESTGKSLLAATAPKPLFLDTENSTFALGDWPEVLAKVKIARRIKWEAADTILKRLADPNDDWADRETVVLDTLDAMQSSNLEWILRGEKGHKQFLPMQHHYKQSAEMIRRWLVDLRDLEPQRHLVVLLHEKEIFTGEDGQSGRRLVRPAATPRVMEVLWRDFDVVGHLRRMGDDWREFHNGLQTHNDDVIRAKSRLRYLPQEILDPTFDYILQAFNHRRNSQQ